MQEQAQARATENALSKIADVCGKSEVLSTQSRTLCENGVVTVSITVEYITNIAVEQIILTEQK